MTKKIYILHKSLAKDKEFDFTKINFKWISNSFFFLFIMQNDRPGLKPLGNSHQNPSTKRGLGESGCVLIGYPKNHKIQLGRGFSKQV